MPVWTLNLQCPLSRAERRSLLRGYLYIKCMLACLREVTRFWEGPLREAPLYISIFK